MAAEQKNLTEGRKIPGPDRTGREGKEESIDKTPAEASNWDRVVDIIQTAFGEGRLVEEATWKAVVLITTGNKYYRGMASWS